MRVAIAGFGAEGQSSYRYYTAKGHDVTIVTNKVGDQYPIPPGAKAIVAEDAFDQLDDFDLVLRTPPMSPHSIRTSGKIWSQTNEFFAECPAPIIGVTGTKGKGTTSSLIASILRAAGKTVHLVGNIGEPALDVLPKIQPDDIVVYELSSFQLWDIERSPHVAVVLKIEPDHLDVHEDLEDYLSAKMNIVAHQTDNDVAIYTHESMYSELTDVAALTEPRGIPVPDEDYIDARDGYFYCYNQPICPIASLQLPGTHNVINACAAIAAAWEYTQDTQAIEQGLRAFTGLPHRLKFVDDIGGVTFYDDSIATTPGSAIAAIRSFDAPIILILGGHDKGADYTELGQAINESTVKMVYAIGANRDKIKAQIKAVSDIPIKTLDTKNMAEIVDEIYRVAAPGDTIILSPAAASFDMFTSYKDRGDQFIAAVKGLC